MELLGRFRGRWRSARWTGGLVPAPHDALVEPTHGEEDGDAEQRGDDHRGVQALGLELVGVEVDEHADARLPLLEEEVADYGADARRAGGDAKAREDRRHG